MARGSPAGVVRIVGGRWRGRRLSVPAAPGLRPTPDRVRETLFNWLLPYLPGARCLDLYAGTGVLGLEALSRGAAEAVLVERSAAVAQRISEAARVLGADGATVVCAAAEAWLGRGPASPFDIVLLDPPYHQGLLPAVLPVLEDAGWLAPEALIYVETARDEPLPAWPANWETRREQRAGDVSYRLLQRRSPAGKVSP